jgi:hypothetical protein
MDCAGKPAEGEFYEYNREFKNNARIVSSDRNTGERCEVKAANNPKKRPLPKCRVGRSLNLGFKVGAS